MRLYKEKKSNPNMALSCPKLEAKSPVDNWIMRTNK